MAKRWRTYAGWVPKAVLAGGLDHLFKPRPSWSCTMSKPNLPPGSTNSASTEPFSLLIPFYDSTWLTRGYKYQLLWYLPAFTSGITTTTAHRTNSKLVIIVESGELNVQMERAQLLNSGMLIVRCYALIHFPGQSVSWTMACATVTMALFIAIIKLNVGRREGLGKNVSYKAKSLLFIKSIRTKSGSSSSVAFM